MADKDLFGRGSPLCCGLINAPSVSLWLRTKPSALINNTRPGLLHTYTHPTPSHTHTQTRTQWIMKSVDKSPTSAPISPYRTMTDTPSLSHCHSLGLCVWVCADGCNAFHWSICICRSIRTQFLSLIGHVVIVECVVITTEDDINALTCSSTTYFCFLQHTCMRTCGCLHIYYCTLLLVHKLLLCLFINWVLVQNTVTSSVRTVWS